MRIRKWTILLGLSLTVLFGLVLPLAFNNKDAAVAVEYQKKKEAAIESFKEELILSASVPVSDPASDTDAVTVADTATASNTDTVTGTETSSNSVTVSTEVATEEIPTEETPLGTVQGTEVKDTWVQAQIDENRNAIDSADLDRGAEIYNSLDTRYIFGLADGGLTDEERAEVDIYLKSQLNGSDYDLAKQLYFKYVGLLNE